MFVCVYVSVCKDSMCNIALHVCVWHYTIYNNIAQVTQVTYVTYIVQLKLTQYKQQQQQQQQQQQHQQQPQHANITCYKYSCTLLLLFLAV